MTDMPMPLPRPRECSRHLARRGALAMGLSLLALAASRRPWGALVSPALAAEPERIVALGGAVTEIIYALGLQDRVVGLDTTSLYPPQALKEKPNVGYLRALSAEGILSLTPSLVIAVDGAGPAGAMGLVAEAGVRIVHVPDDPTLGGVVARIEVVGHLVGATEAARRLADRVRARFAAAEAMRAKIDKPVRVLFLLSLQNGRPVVAGAKTTADAMIGLAGAVNAASGIEGYRPMTDEAVITAAPDAVLMMSNAGVSATSDQVFALPAFTATPAGRSRAFVTMDGLYLLGFGPRAPDAVHDLMSALYPALRLPPLPDAPAPL